MSNAGSRFGKYWPSVGMAIRVAFIGSVFGALLGSRGEDYVPWLASGLIAWAFLSSAFQKTANAYVDSKMFMRSLPIDIRSFIWRNIVSVGLVFWNNLFILVVVLLVFRLNPFPEIMLFIPSMFIILVFLIGTGLLMGPLLARFRDLNPLLNSIIGVMFFALPILWRPADLDDGLARLIVGFNPFYHFLQVIRLPLIGQEPTLTNWTVSALTALMGYFVGSIVFRKTSSRIFYWV